MQFVPEDSPALMEGLGWKSCGYWRPSRKHWRCRKGDHFPSKIILVRHCLYSTSHYRKPSAKAPVIHPGDEALFLVWGGEGSALRCLTEALRPDMLGIAVLVGEKA